MRVLVADDDHRVRLALRLFLEERGLVVVGEASSAQDIDPLVQGLRPDLLLLDWELPGLPAEGGAEVPAWAKALRVVALSSRPMGQPESLASPIEFVCKTDPPDRLLAALCGVEPRGKVPIRDAASRSESAPSGPCPRCGVEWSLSPHGI